MTSFEQILKNEGLSNWKIKFNTGGGLCLYNRKEIWMDKEKDDIALLLHEVAHALCEWTKNDPLWNKDQTGHHAIWGDRFTNLVRKYLT